MKAILNFLIISMILIASVQLGFPLNKKTAQQVSPSGTKAREGLAQKPPMGWNSYDGYGMLVTEATLRPTPEEMLISGRKSKC